LIAQFSLGLAIFGISLLIWFPDFPVGICYFRSVCVLLMLAVDLQQKQNVFHTHKLFMNLFCVRSGASVSFYKRMGLMVAILPTHPRVSEVTCMRADAKRQQDLTGTHAQTVLEKMLSKKIASKKEYLWPYGSMCSQSLRFFVKSCACVLM